MIEAVDDTRGFFQERVNAAVKRLGLELSDDASIYLRELLQNGGSEAMDEPLVTRMAQAMEASDPRERRAQLRQTGDAALVSAGFFHEHLDRRGVSADYVEAMGSRAYAAAAVVPGPRGSVLRELSTSFGGCARVLDEVREATMLRTPQDIVRLYDRWRRTGSPKLAERLQREGVFPGQGGLFGGGGSGTIH